MQQETSERAFVFVGGHRCLDFINTQVVQRGQVVDLLTDFAVLVAWLVQARLLETEEAQEALRRWRGTPEGEHAFSQAVTLRAALGAMVECLVQGQPVPSSSIVAINALLRQRPGYMQLVRERDGFAQRLQAESREAIRLIVPLAEVAGDLLCHTDLTLIKRCENPQCILYFYDETKNHTRRWCSMQVCGNRRKAARHRLRTRRTPDR
jgi:predicted RNA-binding Zn ribbon-like protein